MEIIGFISIFIVGVLLGLMGGGGSVLSLPILIYIFSVDPVLATAYSLFIVGATSIVGTALKYSNEMVDIKSGILFGIPSIVSVFITRAWIVPSIPDIIIQFESLIITKRLLILGIFALLVVLTALGMIFKKNMPIKPNLKQLNPILIVSGLAVGFLTGFVGIGGGFLILPVLVFTAGIPFKSAIGTSLFIISLKSLIGFTGDLINFQIDWYFLISITILSIFGIIIGNAASKSLDGLKLKRSFGWFILIIGCSVLVGEVVQV